MSIGNMTNVVFSGYVIDADRPIVAYEAEISGDLCPVFHEHPRAQLMYASSGVIKVRTSGGIWTVPPSQAVWIPSWTPHNADIIGRSLLKNLFFDPSVLSVLPQKCFVMRVSPLLRELIDRFCQTEDSLRQKNIASVIIDEIACAAEEPLSLPTSDHPYVAEVIERLIAEPHSRKTIDEWAKTANTSPRNFVRVFQKETGMPFGIWRTKLKILCSIERLQNGCSVTETALDLGYQSISSFIESFRKETGLSPLKYLNLSD